jgi:uncharacterized Zn finger protein
VEALEHRAQLDPNRLPRGRTYARTGAVSGLEARSGEIRALVQGSRARPYRVVVKVRRLAAREWESVFDLLASRAGHAAALLEGELPAAVGEELSRAGLDLLPGPGDLRPTCSCPDWAEPCKHAAAVCYLVADLLDEDPFQVFLLRGRRRQDLLAALRARRRSHAASVPGGRAGGVKGRSTAQSAEVGVTPAEVWGREGSLPALPAIPLPAGRPGRPTVLAADPPASSGISTLGLLALAADAAARAFELSQGEESTRLELSFREDLARRAGRLLDEEGARSLGELAGRVGLSPSELRRFALAWRSGGPAGLSALLEPFDPDPDELLVGKELLGDPARARAWRNRVTLNDRQLRLGSNGAWYPYRLVGRSSWEPDGAPLTTGSGAPRPKE